MPFTQFKLHPSLLKGIKDLGFTRPTPIQAEAIPPALAGQRRARVCDDRQRQDGRVPVADRPSSDRKAARQTRALILTPTRELAAQILEDLNDLAVHTPISGAAVFGGVGMGPQEHAFRKGVDVIVATPGRLLDHFQYGYAKMNHIEFLVLDEADRMLDMGFLPDIKRILKHIPARRQTFFFSATMPPPIAALTREMLKNPATINLQRTSAPAVGITHAVYPVAQELKSSLLVALLKRGDVHDALVFTRTKHRANRVADFLVKQGVRAERIHGNRSQSQRTQALAGFKSGKHQVLVATDIAARGIDVEELGHVVNFDVPKAPEDYIHRVGRTARAEMTGDAFTFVSPQEEGDMSRIERALGKRLPRITVPDFDYKARPEARLEQTSRERRDESRAKRGLHGGGRVPVRAAAPAADAVPVATSLARQARPLRDRPTRREPASSGGSRPRRPGRSKRRGRSW